jgi:CubicO group peptidase (beta-lactamase class C family)
MPEPLERAWALVQARRAAAQLCVLGDGEVVLERATGCRPDDLFWIFSASKPYVAMLVHLLAQRGDLSLDDPVAAHWPEFGRQGKELAPLGTPRRTGHPSLVGRSGPRLPHPQLRLHPRRGGPPGDRGTGERGAARPAA